jgi:hypothetical protein
MVASKCSFETPGHTDLCTRRPYVSIPPKNAENLFIASQLLDLSLRALLSCSGVPGTGLHNQDFRVFRRRKLPNCGLLL